MTKTFNHRGYEIKPIDGGYVWIDLRGWTHYYEGVTQVPFKTVHEAQQSIDAVMRAMAPDFP